MSHVFVPTRGLLCSAMLSWNVSSLEQNLALQSDHFL